MGNMNKPIIGAHPNEVGVEWRRRYGVDHAFAWTGEPVLRCDRVKVVGDAGIFPREVRTDHIPSLAFINAAEEHLVTEVKLGWVGRRDRNWESPDGSK